MTAAGAKILMALLILTRSSAFIFSKFIMAELTPFQSLGWRFFTAFLLLALILHTHLRKAVHCGSRLLAKSAFLGICLFAVMACEMYSLRTAAVHTVAFLENLSAALVPLLLALAARRLPAPEILIGCGLILTGAAALTCGRTGFAFYGGEGYALLAALSYSLYIIATGRFARDSDPLSLGVFQMGFMGALSFAAALFLDGRIAFPVQPLSFLSLFIQILLCSCFGFALQPVAQQHIPAQEAGLLCALNPLFASLLGHLVFQEVFDATGVLGALYVLTGMVWVNFSPQKKQAPEQDPAVPCRKSASPAAS